MASGLAEIAKLLVSLELKDNFSKGVKSATASLGKLDTSLGKIGGIAKQGLGNAARNLAKIGAVAAVGVGAMVKSGIESLATLESAVTSVDGAIAQMGLTVSGSQIAAWANEIEAATQAAFDDKAITAATANLIRYGKVSDANLRPAMVVMTDLAARTGDVESASNLLARALADPAKAAGKLAKSGVVLTKAQQDTVKAMVEANDVAGAQTYLLEELAKTTTGAATAMNGPYRDAMLTLGDVAEDAQRALAEGFLPVLVKASKLLKAGLADERVMANIREFGQSLAGGLDSLIEIARNLPWAQIGDSLKIAGAGAKAVLGAFSSLPPWVQTAVLTGWGLNKLTGGALGGIVGELGKGLIKGVLGMSAGVVNLRAGAVTGVGGTGGGAVGGAAGGAASRIGSAVRILGSVAIAGTSLAALGSVFMSEREKAQAHVTEVQKTAKAGIPQLNRSESAAALRKIEETLANPINDLALTVMGGKDELRQMASDLSAHIADLDRTFSVRVGDLTAATASGLSRTTAAANATASVIRNKDMSPKVSVSTNVSTVVSVRAVTNGQTVVSAYNNRGTTNTWGGGR